VHHVEQTLTAPHRMSGSCRELAKTAVDNGKCSGVLCAAGGRYKPPEKQIDVETESAVSKYIAGLLRPMYKAQKLNKEHYKVRSQTTQ